MSKKHKNIFFCILTILIVTTSAAPYLAFPYQKDPYALYIHSNQLENNIENTLHASAKTIFETEDINKTRSIPFFSNVMVNHLDSDETDIITVKGFIYDEGTQEPLNNATVFSSYAYSYYLGLNISYTTTDASGFYILQLPANQYLYILARANLYYMNYSTMNATADDTAWVNISLRYGRVPESSRLCGYITEKNTDKPIENATVMQFWINGNEDIDVNFTWTNSLGYYECDIAYGFIGGISAFAEGHLAFSDFSSSNMFWVDWNETIWRNISLQKIPEENSHICGYIKDQETGNAVEDASVLISWENEVGMNYENITYSDYDGYYKIGASAGNGSIHIIHPDYYYKEFTNLGIIENTTKWINASLESIESMYKTYKYTWSKQDGEELFGLFASKKTPYEDTFTVVTAMGTVLTNVEVQINWEDDVTYGFLVKKGLDILSAEITYNNESISESSKGNGNFTFSFAINDMPADGFVDAKDRYEAEDIIDDLIKDKNEAAFDITVIVETGERIWRLFKYIKDNGNDFEIAVSYVYYLYSLEEVDS